MWDKFHSLLVTQTQVFDYSIIDRQNIGCIALPCSCVFGGLWSKTVSSWSPSWAVTRMCMREIVTTFSYLSCQICDLLDKKWVSAPIVRAVVLFLPVIHEACSVSRKKDLYLIFCSFLSCCCSSPPRLVLSILFLISPLSSRQDRLSFPPFFLVFIRSHMKQEVGVSMFQVLSAIKVACGLLSTISLLMPLLTVLKLGAHRLMIL